MYIATYIIDIAALLFLLWLLYTSTALNNYRKKPFLIGILLTIMIILAEAGTVFAANGGSSLRSINILCNVLGFALAPIIPIAITLIFDSRIHSKHKFLLIPTFINIVAAVLSPLFKFIFYVDANNQYVRGDFFFIFIAVYIINFSFLVIGTLDVGKKYNYPIMRKMIALFLFTIIGTSIQLVNPSAYSSWHCVTLSLFLYFFLMSEFDSSFDTLTGLYTRATFDKAAKQIVKSRAFSVIILDINDFKSMNDLYGHDCGDTVLKTVAAIIKEAFNKRYICYRFGGDEFSVIGKETDQNKIEAQLRTIQEALSKIREKGTPFPTVAYGYSIHKGGKPDFQKSLKEADDRMYNFKKDHKADASHYE